MVKLIINNVCFYILCLKIINIKCIELKSYIVVKLFKDIILFIVYINIYLLDIYFLFLNCYYIGVVFCISNII